MNEVVRSWGWPSLVILLAALGLASTSGAAGAPIPPWLAAVATQEVPAYSPEVPAVVLVREQSSTVGPRAGVTSHTRYAMRVLTRAGCKLALVRFDYLAGSESVREPEAWLLRGGKEVKLPKSRPWADIVSDPAATYNEYRAKTIDYSDVAIPGDVIACEGDVVGTLLFAQVFHAWDSALPTLVERFQVTVPKGWSIREGIDGPMTPIEAQVATGSGVTRAWTLRDTPFRPDEPYAPAYGAFHARVFANLEPPAPLPDFPAPRFQSWADAAVWKRELNAGQCDSSPALVAQTRQLIADCPDELAKVRAIAGYVQRLRYVSVNRALGIGFGYRPRKASEVFSRGWGDCKDKANLMRAMLREAGIASAIASGHARAGRDINAAWPTFYQFNHAIIAISLPAGCRLPSTVTTSTMGELTFFDPTSEHTWLGDLPYLLQGTLMHVISDAAEEVVSLPRMNPERNFLMERVVRASLGRDGSISGTCQVAGSGQAGAELRRMVRSWSARQLEENAGEFISEVLRGSKVTGIKISDDESQDQSTLTLEFSTPKAVQPLPGGAMLVRLDLLSRHALPAFPAKTRTLPVDLPPIAFVDKVRIEVPDGFGAEELPPAATRETLLGSYSMAVTLQRSAIVADRSVRLKGQTVPVSDYPTLRQFLNDIVAADKAAVVVKPVN